MHCKESENIMYILLLLYALQLMKEPNQIHNVQYIIYSTKGKWIWIISWSMKWNFTLGPAGPPLHNGVVVVWQSVQLLLAGAMLLWFMCSASDPCFQKSRLAKLASYTLMNERTINISSVDAKNIRRWMTLTSCLWSMILDTASSYFSGFMLMRRIKGQRNQNGWGSDQTRLQHI